MSNVTHNDKINHKKSIKKVFSCGFDCEQDAISAATVLCRAAFWDGLSITTPRRGDYRWRQKPRRERGNVRYRPKPRRVQITLLTFEIRQYDYQKGLLF